MSDLRDCMMCDEFAGEKDDDSSLNEALLQASDKFVLLIRHRQLKPWASGSVYYKHQP